MAASDDDIRVYRRNAEKCRVIREIWADGGQVKREIVFETDDESEAFAYEWALINMVYGRGDFDGERYYIANEAIEYLGISKGTFFRHVKHKLPTYHYGTLRRDYFRQSDLDRYRGIRLAEKDK